MMCCVYECVCNKIKLLHTCYSVIQLLIPRLLSKLAQHNSGYVCASTAPPQLATVYVKSHSSGRKHRCTCNPFLSANKKDPISFKMKPRALHSKVTSSTSGVRVDNWSHNHRMEIEDPLRASVGGVTLSSSL